MAKFKITIIDNMLGAPVAEVVQGETFPVVNLPQHTLTDGRYGTPIKVELVLDADVKDITDYT